MRSESSVLSLTRVPALGLTMLPMYLLFSLAILVLIALATALYFEKPYVGVTAIRQEGSWTITRVTWGSLAQVEGVRAGSQVISVNGKPVDEFARGLVYIASRKVHSLTVLEPDGSQKTLSDAVAIVPWQTRAAGMALGLLASVFWVTAVLAFALRPGLKAARLFALLSLSIALLIASVMTAQYDLTTAVLLRTFGLILVPALFVHFSLTFPRMLLAGRGRFFIYVPALILVLIYAAWGRREAAFDTWFRQAMSVYLLLGLAAGAITWAYSYITTDYARYRLQLKLALGAAFLALLLLLSLSLLPQVIFDSPLVPSDLVVLGMGVVPVAVAYVLVQEKLPTLVRDKSQVDIRTEASSFLTFATLAGDLATLSAFIVESIAKKVGVSGASLLLYGEDGLKVVATTGDWTSDPTKQTQLTVWGSYVGQDQLFPFLAPPGSGCHLFVPIESRGERVGILCLGAKKMGGFTERDLELLSEVRKSIAIPLQDSIQLENVSRGKKHLEKAPQETEKGAGGLAKVKTSLEKSYLDVARTLVLILESRDPYARGHSERVARLSRGMALELGLPAQDVETVDLAASFHDVGMVAIPDSILLKPGPLNPAEKAEIDFHPTRSMEILGFVSFMEKALRLVEAHHEAWDGSGYPKHLKNVEIPLGARIVAVADAYDAMTSPRTYRAAFSPSEAADRLRAGAGFQWDPQVVQAFLKTIGATQDQ